MMNPLVGKKITAVWLAGDKKAIRFDVDGVDPIIARADGECCSSTWIESLDAPDALLGTVRAVEDIPMPGLGQSDDDEVIQYYGCKIVTERGACVIDYRNLSNGYYGGSIEWPGDSYYGGVWGQSESKMDWQPIAGAQ